MQTFSQADLPRSAPHRISRFFFPSCGGILAIHPDFMTTPLRPRFAPLFRLLALMAACTGVAHAQFQVGLAIDKVQHIVQEPQSVTVTITNRSGADVVLGGARGEKWLSFDVTDPSERSLATTHMDASEPMVFAAGSTISRKVVVVPNHILDQGNYGMKAIVYHAPSGQYYQSNRIRFQVLEGQRYKQPLAFGVPPNYPEAGRTRQYVLMMHQDLERSYLYLRLVDERTGAMLRTFQLGTLTLFRDPQYTLDRFNNLHVMFLTAPTIYRYCVVKPDATLESQSMHKEVELNRPMLYLTGANDVVLKGGVPYDPVAERAAQESVAKKGRGISERPPGL